MSAYLFLDIETLPCERPEDTPPIVAPRYMKDPAKVREYIDGRTPTAHRDTALNPFHGRILCIAAAVGKDDPQAWTGTDQEMLDGLAAYIGGESPIWVGHNILTFDLRWIWLHARAIRHPIRVPYEKWSKNVVDTATACMGPDPRGEIPHLSELARLFGIPGKPDGIDGSKVYDFWLAGRVDEIVAYCKEDVRLVRDVYRVML